MPKRTRRPRSRTRVFYAYPGRPADLGETIIAAIAKVHSETRDARIAAWPDMVISGNRLLKTITDAIDRAGIFACDLTYPNPNVAFELGYAIAKFKPLFVALNPAIDGAELAFKQHFFGLLGIGYSEYSNSDELASALSKSAPWNDLDRSLLPDSSRAGPRLEEDPVVFYARSVLRTDAVIQTEIAFLESRFGDQSFIDNPIENPTPDIRWFVDRLRVADGVIVHLLSGSHVNSSEHNIRSSIVAGLALGFGKPLQMLAHAPFESPTDYTNLLHVHETSEQARSITTDWLSELDKRIPKRRRRKRSTVRSIASKPDIRNLQLGQWVAETEHKSIDEYFFETSIFQQAIETPISVVVGRRGVGKSATLFALRDYYQRDNRNHVCIVKPVGYELAGLLRILDDLSNRSERGYLIESLWKFLIYAELAASIKNELDARPAYASSTEAESRFQEFWDGNADVLDKPLSDRLNVAITSLSSVSDLEGAREQRARISELLHHERIGLLRRHIGEVLHGRKIVSILVDNLDEDWNKHSNIVLLSELLQGLLGVARDVAEDLLHEDQSQKGINVRLTLFLRSDIFVLVEPETAEQDKLPLLRLYWDDPTALARMLELRLERSLDAQSAEQPSDIWSTFFDMDIVGLTPQEFMTNTAIPRPRDLIYLASQAVRIAQNRGHERVTQEDLIEARNRYSTWIFNSVISEDDPTQSHLEGVLVEFAGVESELSESQVGDLIRAAGVDEKSVDFYVDLLCDIGFLAIRDRDGFRTASHEAERRVLRKVSRRLAARSEDEYKQFRIDPAFYFVLQIDE